MSVSNKTKEIIKNSFIGKYTEDEKITDVGFNGTFFFYKHTKEGFVVPENQPKVDEIATLGKQIADSMGKEWTTAKPVLSTEIENLRVLFQNKETSPSGCTLSIRISRPRLAIKDIAELANADVRDLLQILVEAEKGIMIAGRTGSGKTELQKALVGFIFDYKNITLIEDTMDSHLKTVYPEKNIYSWRILPERLENRITYHDQMRHALRNDPDWIILAETRGKESNDVLQSAMTDHAIITTLHAPGGESIHSRMIDMIGQENSINEIRVGKNIVTHLPFGIHMASKFVPEKGVVWYINEFVEFEDYTSNSELISRTLYKIEKEYDEKTGQYQEKVITNPLSKKTLQKLTNLELIHRVPSIYRGIKKKDSGLITA